MFGHVPRALWSEWHPPDTRGTIALACRCALAEYEGGRRVLFETGPGACFPEVLRQRYAIEAGGHRLLRELAGLGVSPADIDDIVLSHLHFDHAGGLLAPVDQGAPLALAFPRARIWISRPAWERAQVPHRRDRASFLPALQELLERTPLLRVVEAPGPLFEGVTAVWSEGHTPGLMLARIETSSADEAPAFRFASDLIPGVAWIHAPVTMGYDRFPERLVEEKQCFVADALACGDQLILTHDPEVAVTGLLRGDSGQVRAHHTQGRLDWQAKDHRSN